MIKKIVVSPKDSKRVVSFLKKMEGRKSAFKRRLEENSANTVASLNKLKR